MKKIILILFLFACISYTKAQNNAFSFYKSDTVGVNFRFTLNIDNADLADVNKVAFYKYVSGTSEPVFIKEISVNKVGNYYLLKDGTQTNMIQHSFTTNFLLPKNEYAGVTKFSFKLFKSSSANQEFDVFKPN